MPDFCPNDSATNSVAASPATDLAVDLAVDQYSIKHSDAPNSAPLFDSFISQSLTAHLGAQTLSDAQRNALSPIALAYIGDAVFELYVRSHLLFPLKKIRDYHNEVVTQVKAEQQAAYVDMLLPALTEVEKDILRRGRNATSGRGRRANAQQYQKSTGFEALLGFLYLSDQARLLDLLKQLRL